MTRIMDNLRIIVDVSGIREAGEHDVSFVLSAFNLLSPNITATPVGETSNTDNTIIVRTNRVTGRNVLLATTGITFDTAETDTEDYFYVAGRRLVEPEVIRIDGPEEILNEIDVIEVVSNFGEPLTDTVTQTGVLRVLDRDGEQLSNEALADVFFSQDTVNVTIPVYMVKHMPLRANFNYGAGANEDNLRYRLSQTHVWLIGQSEVLRGESLLDLPEIGLTGVGVVDSVRVDIPVPAFTEIYDGPDVVSVNIQIQNVIEREITIPSSRVFFIDRAEDMEAEMVIDTLILILRGPADLLEELDEGDITVVVSLADYADRTGRIIVETYTVMVDDFEPEIVGAIDLPGGGIIVNIQRR